MTDDPLFARLQNMARALDEHAAPVTTEEAIRSGAADRRRRPLQRFALVGVAASMVALVGILAWSALNDEDASAPVMQGPTTSSPSTTAPADLDWNALPHEGIAVQSADGPLQLYSLAGEALGNAPAIAGALNGPRILVQPGSVDPEPVSAVEVPDGCTSAEGGGGLRVALCGAENELPGRIELVDSAGQATILRDGLPQVGTIEPAVGHWRWAIPSPDGQWVLAQWSGECEVPVAFVIDVATGSFRTVTGESGGDWVGGASSLGLGWAPDGRAVVSLPESACGTSGPDPGVYLIDPVSGQLDVVVPLVGPSEQSFVWRKRAHGNELEWLVSHALRALGLDGCCGEPSHGGAGVTSGAVFEGNDVGINGAPTGSSAAALPTGSEQRVPLLHGEAMVISGVAGGPYGSTMLAFTCGANTWWMRWWEESTPEVDSLLLLAEALIPHLACTLGEPPEG